LLIGRPVTTTGRTRPAVLIREVRALAGAAVTLTAAASRLEVAPGSAADPLAAPRAVVEVSSWTTAVRRAVIGVALRATAALSALGSVVEVSSRATAIGRAVVEVPSWTAATVGRPVSRAAAQSAAGRGPVVEVSTLSAAGWRPVAEVPPLATATTAAAVAGAVVERPGREVSPRSPVLMPAAELAPRSARVAVAEVTAVTVERAALREAALAACGPLSRCLLLAVFRLELRDQRQHFGLVVVQLLLFMEGLDKLLDVLILAVVIIKDGFVGEAAGDCFLRLEAGLERRPRT
jgi:hypothetical protein